MNAAVIHLRARGTHYGTQCGYYLSHLAAAQLTGDVAAVTCGSCKKTRAYKKATS